MLTAGMAGAQTRQDLQRGYEAAARAEAPGFSGFSAQRGEAFFQSTHGGIGVAATCHTRDPLAPGKHTVTAKISHPCTGRESGAIHRRRQSREMVALLGILIRNLVDNAVRYSSAHHRARPNARRPIGEITLSVTDEGCGVPPDEIERLGGRFYRVLGTG
jgi:hypothetical protein